jgi:transcriptional regulator with XRE-family HTH domain
MPGRLGLLLCDSSHAACDPCHAFCEGLRARGVVRVIVRTFGMDDREMGRRIGYWRRRRKLTQAVFADRLGRSKSWVEKVERGERSADRLSVLDAICGVLQIDISAMIGQEPARSAAACIDDSEVEHIRSALERYPLGQEAAEGPDMSAIRRRLDHVWAAFEFGDYQVMGAALPGLLRDAQRSHVAVGSEESARLLAEVYQVIASTLRKLGEYALAWLAGDRGISVAQQAGDLASVAAAGFRVANALLSMGRPGRALDLNMSLADQLQPECQTEELRALYGHVVLQAAMAAAALGDHGRASELITEARDVARFVTPGSNHYRLAFEPVNVTLHEVGTLVVLGENGRAVEVADAIGGAGLRMLRKERRAALLVDTARACSQAGNRDEALRRLLIAEEVAAPEVHCRPVAQATIADLLHRSVGMPPLALARLAERSGVRP